MLPLTQKWRRSVRRFWRETLAPLWSDAQWSVFIVLGLIAIGLGIDGFRRHFNATGETYSWADLVYRSLQLFPFESGWVEGVNLELQVARFLAPAVVLFAAVSGIMAIFRSQVQLLRARRYRDHVVVCGLGRKGFLLAKGFRHDGEQVVAIEQNESNRLVQDARGLGVPVVIGDASAPETLGRARVGRARRVVAVCGDDAANAEVAARAREIARDHRERERTRRLARLRRYRPRTLTAFVHVAGVDLCDQVMEARVSVPEDEPFRLELVNAFEQAARPWLREFEPFPDPQASHLLIVGAGEMGKHLIVGAAKSWLDRHGITDPKPCITLLDRAARARVKTLRRQYPDLEKVCELVPLPCEIDSPAFVAARFLFDPARPEVSAVYVCLDDEARCLAAGLTLLRRLREELTVVSEVPTVVRMTREGGLPDLVGGLQGLRSFGVLDRTSTPKAMLDGTRNELLARAIHGEYVRYQDSLGQTSETNKSMVAWEALPEDDKESNRRQADHVGHKLRAVDCGVRSLTDWLTPLVDFTDDEVEKLAEMEHDRWVAARRADGWKPGPRDRKRKRHPHLVEWKVLEDDVRDYDRHFARSLPSVLARAGFRVYRLRTSLRLTPPVVAEKVLS
jgi:hypothetical protein